MPGKSGFTYLFLMLCAWSQGGWLPEAEPHSEHELTRQAIGDRIQVFEPCQGEIQLFISLSGSTFIGILKISIQEDVLTPFRIACVVLMLWKLLSVGLVIFQNVKHRGARYEDEKRHVSREL